MDSLRSDRFLRTWKLALKANKPLQRLQPTVQTRVQLAFQSFTATANCVQLAVICGGLQKWRRCTELRERTNGKLSLQTAEGYICLLLPTKSCKSLSLCKPLQTK